MREIRDSRRRLQAEPLSREVAQRRSRQEIKHITNTEVELMLHKSSSINTMRRGHTITTWAPTAPMAASILLAILHHPLTTNSATNASLLHLQKMGTNAGSVPEVKERRLTEKESEIKTNIRVRIVKVLEISIHNIWLKASKSEIVVLARPKTSPTWGSRVTISTIASMIVPRGTRNSEMHAERECHILCQIEACLIRVNTIQNKLIITKPGQSLLQTMTMTTNSRGKVITSNAWNVSTIPYIIKMISIVRIQSVLAMLICIRCTRSQRKQAVGAPLEQENHLTSTSSLTLLEELGLRNAAFLAVNICLKMSS